jgi:hypothetical protein
LASALLLGGTIAAQAQEGFLFQFSFFAKPVPPAEIPRLPEAEAGTEADADVMRAAASAPVPSKDDGPATAADAALSLASAAGAKPDDEKNDALKALEAAADAGQPIALWRLGTMYESGEGVKKDDVRAFGYFSRIANENASTPPSSLEADIVAQSFVKVGEYYREGLPDAGVPKDTQRSVALLMHAATYFADAEAQYEIGRLYLSGDSLGQSVIQGARWLSLAARKGHILAQATLGDLLFNGSGDALPPQPAEGLMWLTIAHDHAPSGSAEAAWIDELLNKAMSVATPDQRSAAVEAATAVGPQVSSR